MADPRIRDISPPLTPDIAVWPGDTPMTREVLVDIDAGAHLDLSTLHATVHLGAHTDAPRHYRRGTPDIASRDLSIYYGPCQVVHVDIPRGERILPAHVTIPITACPNTPTATQSNDRRVAASADRRERNHVTSASTNRP